MRKEEDLATKIAGWRLLLERRTSYNRKADHRRLWMLKDDRKFLIRVELRPDRRIRHEKGGKKGKESWEEASRVAERASVAQQSAGGRGAVRSDGCGA